MLLFVRRWVGACVSKSVCALLDVCHDNLRPRPSTAQEGTLEQLFPLLQCKNIFALTLIPSHMIPGGKTHL